MLAAIILFFAAIVAGLQNALAGGGSFITFPALVLAGLDARAANITSTVALFPGQITTGLAGRRHVTGTPGLRFTWLFVLSLIGGALGGLLLLATPPGVFARLVPWLVLFATAVFAWGSFARGPTAATTSISPTSAAIGQFLIAIYGGYFGGGIGILMLAALTMAGLPIRNAGSTKNVLAGVMNASAVAIFVFSPDVYWSKAVAVAIGAIIGGQIGAWALHRVNEKILRICVIVLGLVLFVGLLLDAP